MPYKRIVLAVALTVFSLAASKPLAPESVPHPIAMFLAGLSNAGKKQITYRAAATGNHFFYEEAAGVTVYVYDGVGYKKQAFLKGLKLDAAMKRYK